MGNVRNFSPVNLGHTVFWTSQSVWSWRIDGVTSAMAWRLHAMAPLILPVDYFADHIAQKLQENRRAAQSIETCCRRVSPQGKGAAGGYWTDSVLSQTTKRSFPKTFLGHLSCLQRLPLHDQHPSSHRSSGSSPQSDSCSMGSKRLGLSRTGWPWGSSLVEKKYWSRKNFTQEFCECSELLKPYGFAWTICNSMSAIRRTFASPTAFWSKSPASKVGLQLAIVVGALVFAKQVLQPLLGS